MSRLKRNWWVAGLLLALGIALLSPLASPQPDGLERVAQDQGLSERAKEPPFRVLAGYLFPGIADERLATVLAGLLGTLVLFGVGYGLAWLLARRRRPGRDAAGGPGTGR